MKVFNRKMLENVKERGGFTLVETLVALSILSFGILAIASMQGSSLRGTQHAYNVTEGTSWAEQKIEELMTRSYAHADLDAGAHSETFGDYDIDWTVTMDSPVQNTKTINVRVSWTVGGWTQKVSALDFIVMDSV